MNPSSRQTASGSTASRISTIAFLLLATTPLAGAADLIWDPNPVLAGPQTGSGDWFGPQNWINSSGANQAWVDGSNAVLWEAPGAGFSIAVGNITVGSIHPGVSTIPTPYPNPSFTLHSGTITLAGAVHTISALGSLEISTAIAGSEGMRIGGGRVTLSGTNIYTGPTEIVTSASAWIEGGISFPDTGTLRVDGKLNIADSETIGTLSGDGDITLARNVELRANIATSTTFSGEIGGGGSLTKLGGGTLTFNRYALTAGTRLNLEEGTVVVESQDGAVFTEGMNLGAGTTLRISDDSEISLNVYKLTGTGNLQAVAGKQLFVHGSGHFAGVISSTSNVLPGNVLFAGSHTLTGQSIYTGATSISGAVVVSNLNDAGVSGPLGAGSKIALVGGTLEYNGQTPASTNRAFVIDPSTTNAIKVTNDTVLTLGGVFSDSEYQQGAFRKTGIGTLLLTQNNTYTRSTLIEEGVLQVSGGNALPNTLGTTSIAAGAKLQLLANEEVFALAGAGTADLGPNVLSIGDGPTTLQTFSGAIAGSGSVIVKGKAALTGTSSFAGGVAVPGGSLSVPFIGTAGVDGPLGNGGAITLGDATRNGRLIVTGQNPGSSNRSITLQSGGGTIEVAQGGAELSLRGPLNGSGPLVKSGPGRLRLETDYNGPIVVAGGFFTPGLDISGSVRVTDSGVVDSEVGPTRTFSYLIAGGGILAPGGLGVPGVLTTNRLALESGTYSLDMSSSANSGYDRLVVNGPLEGAGSLELGFNLLYDPQDHMDSFWVMRSSNPVGAGGFLTYRGNVLVNGEEFLVENNGQAQYFAIRYDAPGENGVQLAAIPEPTAGVLFGGTLVAALAARRRRRE